MSSQKSELTPEYKRIFEGRVRSFLIEKKLVKPRSNEPLNYDLLTPLELSRWFVNSVRPTITPDSFRVYRRSIEVGILEVWPTDAGTREAVNLLKESNAVPKRAIHGLVGKRASALRRKRCTEADMAVLHEAAESSRMQHVMVSLIFLAATRHTGFRPTEWIYAREIETSGSGVDGIRLKVETKTIKSGSEERAAQAAKLPYRTIPIPLFDEIDDSELLCLRQALNYVSIFRSKIEDNLVGTLHESSMEEVLLIKWQDRLRKFARCLSRLNQVAKTKRLFNASYPNITLYSARHEFAARHRSAFKQSKLSLQESEFLIAALMGHNNKDTQAGYGTANDDLDEVQVLHSIDDLKGQALFIAKEIINT